jgi:hypothetical protein
VTQLDPTRQTSDRLGADQWLPVISAAAALGLLADGLFNGVGLGVNVPLWIGALILAFVFVARRGRRPLGRQTVALLVVSFALSTMVAWRAAAALQVVPLAASLVLLLLALVIEDKARLRRASISALAVGLALGLREIARGVVVVPEQVPWRALAGRGTQEDARALGRAALIAAPLVLVFGGLFIAADSVFQDWVGELLSVDLPSVRRHLWWLVGGTTVSVGVLWCGLGPQPLSSSGPQLTDDRRLRAIELGVVLGALVILFATFVVVQIQYLFGGEEHVLTSTGVTYAEYARRGFFELVAVAVLLLPVLLAADWARARSGRSLTTYRVCCGLLVLLLFVIMASAFQRLRIYIDVFGLTALRFYAAALLAWLAVGFTWLLWTLLRGRRNEFIGGAAFSALAALVVVIAVNPHGLIASTNLARAEEGRDFDVAHALRLSADATPTILGSIDALEDDDACEVAGTLLARWGAPDRDLRSWNWGRASAADSVDAHEPEILAACR